MVFIRWRVSVALPQPAVVVFYGWLTSLLFLTGVNTALGPWQLLEALRELVVVES